MQTILFIGEKKVCIKILALVQENNELFSVVWCVLQKKKTIADYDFGKFSETIL